MVPYADISVFSLFVSRTSEWLVNPLAPNQRPSGKVYTSAGVTGVWLTRTPHSVKYALFKARMKTSLCDASMNLFKRDAARLGYDVGWWRGDRRARLMAHSLKNKNKKIKKTFMRLH